MLNEHFNYQKISRKQITSAIFNQTLNENLSKKLTKDAFIVFDTNYADHDTCGKSLAYPIKKHAKKIDDEGFCYLYDVNGIEFIYLRNSNHQKICRLYFKQSTYNIA